MTPQNLWPGTWAAPRVIPKTTKSANKLPCIKRRRRRVSLEHQLKQKSTVPEKETSSLPFIYIKRVKLVSLEEYVWASKTQEELRRGSRFCVPATVSEVGQEHRQSPPRGREARRSPTYKGTHRTPSQAAGPQSYKPRPELAVWMRALSGESCVCRRWQLLTESWCPTGACATHTDLLSTRGRALRWTSLSSSSYR